VDRSAKLDTRGRVFGEENPEESSITGMNGESDWGRG